MSTSHDRLSKELDKISVHTWQSSVAVTLRFLLEEVDRLEERLNAFEKPKEEPTNEPGQ